MSKLDSIRQRNTSEHNAREADFEKLQTYVETLQASHDELLEALKAIAKIENRMNGGDWDEIRDAREIASVAIKKAQAIKDLGK